MGADPYAGLTRDPAGNFYGTTYWGGTGCPDTCGTVFEVSAAGKESLLYSFTFAVGDGAGPMGGLIRDTKGNLYGTTYASGHDNCDPGVGCGTVFKLDKNGKMTILHQFTGGKEGAHPYYGSSVMDASISMAQLSAGAAPATGSYSKLLRNRTRTTMCC